MYTFLQCSLNGVLSQGQMIDQNTNPRFLCNCTKWSDEDG